ncbi:MAG: S-methyl-5-thioribose-1-phosphate isomerase [Verrucomicrobiae bacterium]|nr:S-methyl-5-thioribose-1-phosphate isomerase [Verrucomicrobiae bacterium]
MKVQLHGQVQQYRTVSFDVQRNVVRLIDQRLLPHEFRLVELKDYQETAQAIKDMVVRGAPAIAATAAYGLAQGVRAFQENQGVPLADYVHHVENTLARARPTAVDPQNAIQTVLRFMKAGRSLAEQQALALQVAEQFAQASVEECLALGRHGAPLIKEGMRILTHCNAGWLACVDVGTATAPLYAAHQAGRRFHVFCDETRPRCQGASLTAWELHQEGISHEVIADNAAGHLMQRGEIDLVIVGSDRTLGRTGQVANKIGTYTKAVLAHRHNIPFYVAIPLSTLDWRMKDGLAIPIEEREEEEVLGAWGVPPGKPADQRCYVRIANPGSHARNPGFDVTPPELITGIITPVGIFRPQELWENRHRLGGPVE